MACAQCITKKMGGRYQKENYVLLMNVKKEEDQTVMECAYHIRQSSSCYFRSAAKLITFMTVIIYHTNLIETVLIVIVTSKGYFLLKKQNILSVYGFFENLMT